MSWVEGRVTETVLRCPSWCTVTAEAHEEEAHESTGSWFNHMHFVRDDKVALIYVGQLQTFDEQRDDESEEDPFVVCDVRPEVLDIRTTKAIHADLGKALALAQGGGQS